MNDLLASRPPVPPAEKWHRYRSYSLHRFGYSPTEPNVFCSVTFFGSGGGNCSVSRSTSQYDNQTITVELSTALEHLKWMRQVAQADSSFTLERYVSPPELGQYEFKQNRGQREDDESIRQPAPRERRYGPAGEDLGAIDQSPTAPGRDVHYCRDCTGVFRRNNNRHQDLRVHMYDMHRQRISKNCSTHCRYRLPEVPEVSGVADSQQPVG